MSPDTFIPDGRIHRVKGESGKSGWYISHGNWGAWGDWATGEKHKFSDGKYDKEVAKFERREKKKKQYILHKKVAGQCLRIWEDHAHHNVAHNYLERKQIQEYAVKWYRGDLLIPLCDINGKIWNLQKIDRDGRKLFVKDGLKKGCMFRFGDIKDIVILCEGYATAASIHQCTMGMPVVVCFDAYNLFEVCRIVTRKYRRHGVKVYIAADDDCWKPETGNTGVRQALRCATHFRAGIIKPSFKNPRPGLTDFNDLHVTEGPEAVYEHFKFLGGQ